MGAYLNTIGKDRLAFSGSYGPGLGRYLLGLGPTSAGAFDPADGRIKVLDNYGGLVWYQHFWTSKLQSTIPYHMVRRSPRHSISNLETYSRARPTPMAA